MPSITALFSGRACTHCGGKLTLTGGSEESGVIILDCPAGHRTMIGWPPGKPEEAVVYAPKHLEAITADLHQMLAALPRKPRSDG